MREARSVNHIRMSNRVVDEQLEAFALECRLNNAETETSFMPRFVVAIVIRILARSCRANRPIRRAIQYDEQA